MANNQQLLLGEGAGSAPAVYIEDVFSTYLYTGNGSTQTITNGIDLSTKGGLVWIKGRSVGGYFHVLTDSARGVGRNIYTNDTFAQSASSLPNGINAFNTNGFGLGTDSYGNVNTSGDTFASWTFRKQPKFFDVVTYSGTNAAQTVSHTLGSTPGCVIIKCTNTGGTSWWVRHRSVTGNAGLLNSTSAFSFNINDLPTVSSTSLSFSGGQSTNVSGETYVAYLFAHDAGGFGMAGTDNVISCGSYTTTGNDNITLGYEPQFIIEKRTNDVGDWLIFDTMRGMSQTNLKELEANTSAVESSYAVGYVKPTATGYNSTYWSSGQTVIYIAIRRGPMKVPTVGTSVFSPLARTGTGTNPTVVTTNTNPDLLMSFTRTAAPAAYGTVFFDKLRGVSQILQSANTNAEATTFGTFCLQSFLNTGFQTGADFIEGYLNYSGSTYAQYSITRAPGFFDEVCWTGTNADQTLTHNLTVVPELIIYKVRGAAGYNWEVSSNFAASNYVKTILNLTNASSTLTYVGGGSISAQPTATQFSVGQFYNPASTMVAYLFATCAGVSKVGSYTGNGSSQTIACGFTAGSRFVMIKRTDSTGDWYVWDSARGIVAGNDPHLSLNTTAAEVTTDDSVDTDNSGFIVNQLSATNVNVSSASYIFLAVS